jgi:hypothetical protein
MDQLREEGIRLANQSLHASLAEVKDIKQGYLPRDADEVVSLHCLKVVQAVSRMEQMDMGLVFNSSVDPTGTVQHLDPKAMSMKGVDNVLGVRFPVPVAFTVQLIATFLTGFPVFTFVTFKLPWWNDAIVRFSTEYQKFAQEALRSGQFESYMAEWRKNVFLGFIDITKVLPEYHANNDETNFMRLLISFVTKMPRVASARTGANTALARRILAGIQRMAMENEELKERVEIQRQGVEDDGSMAGIMEQFAQAMQFTDAPKSADPVPQPTRDAVVLSTSSRHASHVGGYSPASHSTGRQPDVVGGRGGCGGFVSWGNWSGRGHRFTDVSKESDEPKERPAEGGMH